MRSFSAHAAFCAVLVMGLIMAQVMAQAGAQERPGAGAVPQNVPPAISQKQSVPPLALSQAQREKIGAAVRPEDTEVSFALKNAKSAQSFQPSVGAKLPKGLGLHPLPQPLVAEIKPLEHYTYVKFKDQVLIVNPMTRVIVDMFPQS
jgi:Protein of unknown function (DUF1236)